MAYQKKVNAETMVSHHLIFDDMTSNCCNRQSFFELILGNSGPLGPQGSVGISGSIGYSGPKGFPGVTMTGYPGRDGYPGISGIDGSNGDRGEPGNEGMSFFFAKLFLFRMVKCEKVRMITKIQIYT